MIAAGEVVERPASVVKELVENSLDAQARTIQIAIENGGRTRIVVSDNGTGMERDDAQLAIRRHATSKILTEFDLFRIKTLGFRGEALPSIIAVSRLEMLTSTGTSVGTSLEAHEDQIVVAAAPAKKGTTITVSELFYNTPARLKYLKSDVIENAATIEVAARLALGHPHVAFSLTIDDKLQFSTSGRDDQLATIHQVFGANVARHMIPIAYACPDFTISGFLGKPDIARSNRYQMITLLNGRAVHMPKIVAAIIECYRDFLAPSRFPFVVLNFKIDAALVDVNVHPSKREIRFSKEDSLRAALRELIPLTLSGTTLFAQPSASKVAHYKSEQVADSTPLELFEPGVSYQPPSDEVPQSRPYLRALAQLHDTYIVSASPEGGFVFVDQHAAAERINYEKYQALALTSNYAGEPILPLVIDLKPSDMTLLTSDKIATLNKTGLEITLFGPTSIKVVSLPLWAREDDERSYAESLIDQVLHEDVLDVLKLRDESIASKSCKRSLKANQRLSLDEMQTLLDRLMKTMNPYACPHGRPTMVEFSRYELEKMFKRTGFQ